jgi:hypothetical protein
MSFLTDVIQKDIRFNSTAECRDPTLLEPHFRTVVEAIIADAASHGWKLEIGETFRSKARQEYLFAKGATELKDVGVHGYGLACDLLYINNGKYDTIGPHYSFLMGLCKVHSCPWGDTVWGGNWDEPNLPHSFRDWDHIQAITLAEQPKLFSGEWYPEVVE